MKILIFCAAPAPPKLGRAYQPYQDSHKCPKGYLR